ncbi:Retron-type reverse transcriptase [Vibrio campbellii]|nr:Retron-type reverse transcriptase [Vibrio campbellii]
MRKLITQMDADEAKSFLLKHSSYTSLSLPPYFDFTELLANIDEALLVKPNGAKDIGLAHARKHQRLNYTLQTNKGGHYAWRPIELIHPALYVQLVHTLTKVDNWQLLKNRFEEFSSNPKISCASIPRESDDEITSDAAESVKGWWDDLEQASISRSLDYKYLFLTDVANFYPSIYTHSIPWAIHDKESAKTKRNRNDCLGNEIDYLIQDMRNGQTNGIPQGSVLMDFIAEIIMGYVDISISTVLSQNNIDDYHIVRYRDDYRIFTNSKESAELIVKHLTTVLQGIGLQLNASKTYLSEDIILDSLKPDKREALMLFGKTVTGTTIQKSLLKLSIFSRKYQNSGQLERYLSTLNRRIVGLRELNENVEPIVSILADIMYHNPRVFATGSLLLSSTFKFVDHEMKLDLIARIQRKFEPLLGTGPLDIWLQRLSYPIQQDIEYKEVLCKVVSQVYDSPSEEVWNSDWITDSRFKKRILSTSFVNSEVLTNLDSIIQEEEVVLFPYFSGESSSND